MPEGPWPANDHKAFGIDFRTHQADQRGRHDDHGERHRKEENGDERESRDGVHRRISQRTPTDPQHRLDDDRKDRRFDAKENRVDQRQMAVEDIDDAENQHHQRPRKHEENARDQPADRPVKQPAHVRRELLGLGTGKQHAVIEGVQVPRLADPASLVDEDPVHHGDLPRRAAKTQQPNFQPDQYGVAKRHLGDAALRSCRGRIRAVAFSRGGDAHRLELPYPSLMRWRQSA